MNKFLVGYLILFSASVFAAGVDYGYLKPEDQKYYKNDIMEGNNARERTDSLVKEINKVYGELASLKAEITQLRAEVEELKKKK